MILYAVSAEVSVGEMFIAGFGPGIFIGLTLMAFCYVYCKYKGWGKGDGEGKLPFGKATLQAGWALFMPVIILGGLTSVPGAIIGGLIIGVGEKLSEVYLGPMVGGGIEIWFAYVLALVFLLFRPQGLFGEKIIDRV